MEPLTITAVLSAAGFVAKELFQYAKTHASSALGNTTADKVKSRLRERAQDISQVKTLLCLDTPAIITDFYSPQHAVSADGRRIVVHNADSLPEGKRTAILGVAGQGKSMLLRYLALSDIANRRLPLLVELRNFEHTRSVPKLLEEELLSLGFENSPLVADHILSAPTTTIYLDAFDEIPEGLQGQARKQIEDLARRHSDTRLIVSSRPALTIEASSIFPIIRLDDLRDEESINALKSMANADDKVETIVTALNTTNKELRELLNTPLMVALLLLHYRLTGKFPDTELAFYDDLFDVLLRRHDQTKGYCRKRASSASEIELRELFSYLCYTYRKQERLEAVRNNILSSGIEARSFHGRNYDAADAVTDVINGTNLLLEDGASCRFAHKSIQEFYSASFLASQPEVDLGTFLKNRLSSWSPWSQVLDFIELLKPYLFYKHFLLPHARGIAFAETDKPLPRGWEPSHKVYDRIFGKDILAIRGGRLQGYLCSHLSNFYPLRNHKYLASQIMDACRNLDWETLSKHEINPEMPNDLFAHLNESSALSVGTLLSLPDTGDMLREILREPILSAFKPVYEHQKFVDHRESQADMFS